MPLEPTPSLLEALVPLERRIKEAIYLSATEAGGDISPDLIMLTCQLVVNELAEQHNASNVEEDEEEYVDPVVGFDVDPDEYECDEYDDEDEDDDEDDEVEYTVPYALPTYVCTCGAH